MAEDTNAAGRGEQVLGIPNPEAQTSQDVREAMLGIRHPLSASEGGGPSLAKTLTYPLTYSLTFPLAG